MDAQPMIADRREAILYLDQVAALVACIWFVSSATSLTSVQVLLALVCAVVLVAFKRRFHESVGARVYGPVVPDGERWTVWPRQSRPLRIAFLRPFPAIRTLVTGRPAGSVNLTAR